MLTIIVTVDASIHLNYATSLRNAKNISYIEYIYTTALLNGTSSLIPLENSISPLDLAFLMKALKIAYVGTKYHGNAWQVAWIRSFREVDEGGSC